MTSKYEDNLHQLELRDDSFENRLIDALTGTNFFLSVIANVNEAYYACSSMSSMQPGANAIDDEEKPSFGGRLDHLIASPSPSRQARRLKERQSPSSGNASRAVEIEINEESLEASNDACQSSLNRKRKSRASVATPAVKKEDKSEDSTPSPETGCIREESNTPSRSSKKRKVYDEKQFEGMKGLPDRIAPGLDSK